MNSELIKDLKSLNLKDSKFKHIKIERLLVFHRNLKKGIIDNVLLNLPINPEYEFSVKQRRLLEVVLFVIFKKKLYNYEESDKLEIVKQNNRFNMKLNDFTNAELQYAIKLLASIKVDWYNTNFIFPIGTKSNVFNTLKECNDFNIKDIQKWRFLVKIINNWSDTRRVLCKIGFNRGLPSQECYVMMLDIKFMNLYIKDLPAGCGRLALCMKIVKLIEDHKNLPSNLLSLIKKVKSSYEIIQKCPIAYHINAKSVLKDSSKSFDKEFIHYLEILGIHALILFPNSLITKNFVKKSAGLNLYRNTTECYVSIKASL
ncbi:hypothetical protein HERIO_1318 [Hepatospora eriocheir]|uniref:Uncharacterized protein n=1 Tax=Hepatospora eriocheir TaxID=1081669 RepID=A0A1X0QAI5_9MICR|nr:hypothetical protein HERIO_1318 [Hepatospora eriocheir]